MTKLLAFAFWELRRFFLLIYDDGLAEWKAIVILGGSQMAAVLALLFAASVGLGRRLLPGGYVLFLIFGLAISLTAANYYLLCYENRWARFEAEFARYSILAQVIGGVTVLLVLALCVAAGLISAAAVSHLPGH